MRTSERRRLLHEQLQRDAEKAARDATMYGTGRPPLTEDERAEKLELLDGLRRINRSATRALDTAGVPDGLQGAGQEEWEDFE